MSGRVHFPHDLDLRPGTWRLSNHGHPILRCPACRKAGEMINHSVDPDGTVNASIGCYPPCDYHVWGVLDGWPHGKKEASKPII